MLKLAQGNFRRKERKLVAEGIRLVEEAALSDWTMEALFYTLEAAESERVSKIIERAETKGANLYPVSEQIMAEMAGTEKPQGILAVLWQPDYALTDVLPHGFPALVVVVDGIQDPGNLGTIVRSADAAGATGVILLKGTVDLYNQKAIRSTMGSLFHMPVVTAGDIEGSLEYLISTGLKLLIGDPVKGGPIFEEDLSIPIGIVVGNEGMGPRDEVLAVSHKKVNIPMPGRAESLNVAMAASIMLYEAVRQRYKIQ
ncbi:hypothetical protein N752_01900 [Desulforamulus aquiferis]|nr:RNA methyltransferase [Desulforamulus aquiferis]RYD06906.1 hypothetical protein N752_01900 [Desulforamulus aquiferis]